MMKVLTFVLCLLAASAAAAQDRVISLKSGDTVSAVVAHQLGSAKYWTSSEVLVLRAKSDRQYAKDEYTMSRLPVGTRVVIKAQLLAQVRSQQLPSNQVVTAVSSAVQVDQPRVEVKKLVPMPAVTFAVAAARSKQGLQPQVRGSWFQELGVKYNWLMGIGGTFISISLVVGLFMNWLLPKASESNTTAPSSAADSQTLPPTPGYYLSLGKDPVARSGPRSDSVFISRPPDPPRLEEFPEES